MTPTMSNNEFITLSGKAAKDTSRQIYPAGSIPPVKFKEIAKRVGLSVWSQLQYLPFPLRASHAQGNAEHHSLACRAW
jgi:hypothetical protein